MLHIENLENRVHLSGDPLGARVKALRSINLAVSSISSSFAASSKPGAKGIETLFLENLGDVTAHGRIKFVLTITDSGRTSYPLRVTVPIRGILLRPLATKAFQIHAALPPKLPSDSNYVLTGSVNVLSGFTDPVPNDNSVDFSSTPISVPSDTIGDVGYFAFSPFRATEDSGSARIHNFYETGTVNVFPGGSVQYTYQYSFGTGTLQITDVDNTTNNVFALFDLSILHRAPTRLNGKTISIVASSKGASGSGSLIEEGFAVPGLTWTEQVAYFKVK